MGRVVAIGGGELDTTQRINRHALALTGKQTPNLLFISTASRDAEGYIAGIQKTFEALGCTVESLRLVSGMSTEEEIDRLLTWADVIYVGGGDTIFMMDVWKQHKLDHKLREIYAEDRAVLMGLSAGAICWFDCGHSDSLSFRNTENWNYCWAEDMLDIFHMAYCPHYDESGRESFDAMLHEKDMDGLAMENNTAFVQMGNAQYYIRSDENAQAYRLHYTDGVLHKQAVVFADMDRIERILQMETLFDRLQKNTPEDIIADNALEILKQYQSSGQWLEDYEADERGELPVGLKRGVLSQDGLYNFLSEIE